MSNLWIFLAIQAGLLLSVHIQFAYSGDVCQYDKNKITCKESFLGTDFTMTVKLEVCDEDVSATVSLKGAGVDYSHKFKSETDVPIQGMSAGPLGKVYLRVVLRRSWDEAVYIKISLAVKVLSFGKSLTIIDKSMGKIENTCGFFAWLNSQSAAVQVGIYGSAVIVFLCKMGCLICCCRRRSNSGVTLSPPVLTVQQFPLNQQPVSSDSRYAKL